MSSSLVILDDQDATLKYTNGLWNLAGSDINYSQTLYASNSTGATMTFSFSGTHVALIGDFTAGGTCSATFTLDGASTSFNSPNLSTSQHQQTIFSSDVQDGEHTLVYNVSSCSASGNATGPFLWIDYLLYAPSPNLPLNGSNLFIDDADPSLTYSGNWTSLGEDGDFRHTKHGGTTGSAVQFTFNGVFISVHGRVNNGTGITTGTFSVDGGSPTTFSAPLQSTISYNEQLYKNANLPPGQHTLTITSQSDNPLWIDYFLVETNGSLDSISTGNGAGSPSKAGLSTTTIVGIAVGSVVFAAVVIVLVIFYLRRRASRRPKVTQEVQYKQTRPLPSDAASSIFRSGDGYSYISPSSLDHSRVALLSPTSHNYPPSSISNSTSFETTSSPPPPTPTTSRRNARSSNALTLPSTSGSSSMTSGLSRMQSVAASQTTDGAYEDSLMSRSTSASRSRHHSRSRSRSRRHRRRELPQPPPSEASHHTVHVDSGYRQETEDIYLMGDDKTPPEPPPAYTR